MSHTSARPKVEERRFAARFFRGILAASLLVGVGSFTPRGSAYMVGPPLGMTGGFGEDTCYSCHFDYGLNQGEGSLELEGIPDTYTPAKAYPITVRLTHPRMERGGFELAVRFSEGDGAGQQAGSLNADDDRVAVVLAEGSSVQYAWQTEDGSVPEGELAIRWTLRWMAPNEGAGPVVFHVAGNAGNYDESALGDFPYATQITSRPRLIRPER